ncbi:MAG: hypothetical protein A2096_15870 [Spirochaetes bacterium GWF1_41_5]|nr:MAG: hypothetical protein A2096_15870 [Spirochaetes bacterium GWF1_41_5]HBE03090.1 hypothetical protein [Spirochaetia bacterium]
MIQSSGSIITLTPAIETYLQKMHHLNIDLFTLPSPYVYRKDMSKDYEHSYVYLDKGEIIAYFLIYSNPEKNAFHLYKQVTSPFRRGAGIGSAFFEKFASNISNDSLVFLFSWEKNTETFEFFQRRGFEARDKYTDKKLTFIRMEAKGAVLKEKLSELSSQDISLQKENLDKARHDANKILRLMSNFINILTVENCQEIIETIKNENNALVNLLNSWEENNQLKKHEIDLTGMVVDRIMPFIEMSRGGCRFSFTVEKMIPRVQGHYSHTERALVNLISNSLEAIEQAGRSGKIYISIKENYNDTVSLTIRDNGSGIDEEYLRPGEDGLPRFVGLSINRQGGHGMGSRQIFDAFGRDNIHITSRKNRGTTWEIFFKKIRYGAVYALNSIRYRVLEIQNLLDVKLSVESFDFSVTIPFIWQIRKTEILLYDIIYLFSERCNIRDVFRSILDYRYGSLPIEKFKDDINSLRPESGEISKWVIDLSRKIKSFEEFVLANVQYTDKVKYSLFASYAQATEKIIVFTLDPERERFLCADRKLVEHADLALFLGRDKEDLLRGEYRGDLKEIDNPVYLGVWRIDTADDFEKKLKLLRRGAQALIAIGINKNKKVKFYETTSNTWQQKINTLKILTLEKLAGFSDSELFSIAEEADDYLENLVFVG